MSELGHWVSLPDAFAIMSLLLQNGRLIDPAQAIDRIGSLRIADGKIVAYDVPPADGDQVIDCTDKIIAPGLIDLHVRLGEPGLEEDETIETGTAAALAGGFTTIACIADTDPPIDTPAGVQYVLQKAARAGHCHVLVIAAVSKNLEGKELAEIGSLVEAGAIGFSDASSPIHNPELLRRALEYCQMFDRPVMNHPESLDLSHGGIMHEGMTSLILGLTGMPAEAEDVMTSRDLRLAEATGGRLHLMNISSAGSVELIRRVKARGQHVTAAVTPHHLTLTDENLRSFDANFKLNPPLRSAEHVEACVAGLQDGTLDCITSGHDPRAVEKKMQELDRAPFGAVGLETTLGLVITKLIEPGLLDWPTALAKLTCGPASVLGIDKGTLRIGAEADVTVIDPNASWVVEPSRFYSMSGNTPLAGWELHGKAIHTIVGGEVRSPRIAPRGEAVVVSS